MISFGLTPNIPATTNNINDIYMLPNGQLAIVDNIADLTQSVTCAISLWLGEYNFNTQIGVPWKILLSAYDVNNPLIEFQLRNAVLSFNNNLSQTQLATYGINKIQSFSYNKDAVNRQFNLNIVVLLNNGSSIPIDLNI